ncbi:MAG: LysR family transcriptional regulator [Pseudomonadota bacterium]
MAKSLPPLTWFRAFEAAARHLSFTAAAEEIGMTQSAVSQQVKLLETRLQVTLFTRRARGLSLTDDGRRLLPDVGAALDTLSRAARRFEAGPSRNLLSVATSVSVAQWIIAPHLRSFTGQHPHLRLRFLSAIWPDDFHSERADVEVRFGSAKQVGHNARALTPDGLIAVKAAGVMGTVADAPLIEAVGTSVGWRHWAEAVGGDPQPSLFADSYGMALQLAAQGNGIALASALLARHALASGVLERAHPAELPAPEGYYLWVKDGHPEAAAFADWLLAQLATYAPV